MQKQPQVQSSPRWGEGQKATPLAFFVDAKGLVDRPLAHPPTAAVVESILPLADGQRTGLIRSLDHRSAVDSLVTNRCRSGEATISATVLPLDQLDEALRRRWCEVRRRHPSILGSPFLSLEFADAVHRARGDVDIATFGGSGSGKDTPIGFLPFHRLKASPWGTQRISPVGRFFNDAQAVIGPPGGPSWPQVAQAIGCTIDLHAAVQVDPASIQQHALQPTGSFMATWPDSSSAYRRRLEQEHRTIGKQRQKTRKLGREVGPLRLEVDCLDEGIAERLIAMKRQQYDRTRILDHFAPAWTRRLMTELAAGSSDGDLGRTPMRRLVSVLWAGDHLVAGHLGLIERGRLHYWFPVYDPAMSAYSPGTALFTELLSAATDHGIVSIDMGYGEQPYKRKQTTATSNVWCGRITTSPIDRWQGKLQRAASSAVRHAPCRPTFKRILRRVAPQFGVSKLR